MPRRARSLRFGELQAVQQPGGPMLHLSLPLNGLALRLAGAAIVLGALLRCQEAVPADPERGALSPLPESMGDTVNSIVFLEQNWTPEESLEFYQTSQGSHLIPY